MAGLVVITRPIEDAHDYAQELQAQGFQTLIEPMLVIEPVEFDVRNLVDYDGVLVTSANAVEAYRDGGGAIDADISVYCVGKHTAEAAQSVGFENVVSVDGTGANLLAYVLALPCTSSQKFIHICGRHVAFPLVGKLKEEGVQVEALQVYDSVQVKGFSEVFLNALKNKEIDAVTFFSKRTAEAFSWCVRESESESCLEGIKALSISSPVVECVRVFPWYASYISKSPDRVGMMQVLKAYASQD